MNLSLFKSFKTGTETGGGDRDREKTEKERERETVCNGAVGFVSS